MRQAGLGPAAQTPPLHHQPALRWAPPWVQPALGRTPAIDPPPTLDQYRHNQEAALRQESPIHPRPPVLEEPAIRDFPTIQGRHDGHTRLLRP